MIDWCDPKEHITEHFTVHEALFLPSWKVYHIPSEEEKSNIMAVALVMEKIRKLFKHAPITVNSWIRPNSVSCLSEMYDLENYNYVVGGAPRSMHLFGSAVDFTVKGYGNADGCMQARHILLPHLKDFGIRLENLDRNWIHIDTKEIEELM